jgi:hypothetical protein
MRLIIVTKVRTQKEIAAPSQQKYQLWVACRNLTAEIVSS